MADKAIERYEPISGKDKFGTWADMLSRADGDWMRYDAELVRDAMRYRKLLADGKWFGDKYTIQFTIEPYTRGYFNGHDVNTYVSSAIDTAIDAARIHNKD